jgi:hypothetical protein
MIRTKKFEDLPQITSISPSGKIVVTENGVDKVISFEDFSNLPPANDVWNNASTTFTASEVNVTDIQSAADSKLLDLKVNTVSKFVVRKDGNLGIGVVNPAARLDISDTVLAGSGSLAGSVLNLVQTWNTTGNPTAIKLNVTNTASGAASNLLDLQLDNISRFRITKGGVIDFGPSNNAFFRSAINCGAGQLVTFTRSDVPDRAYAAGGIYNGGVGGLFLGNGLGLRWSNGSFADSGGYDLTILRRAAANLNLGSFDAAAPVAQTLSVQSVIAGTSNTAGANFTIDGSQGTGTGIGGSIVFRTAPAGSSGTAVNALATALTLTPTRHLIIGTPSSGFQNNGLLAMGLSLGTNSGNTDTLAGEQIVMYASQLKVAEYIFGTRLKNNSAWNLEWSSTSGSAGASDLILLRDAANTLGLRNGVNPQAFRLYNTYTDASNYERSFLKWDTNEFIIGTEKNGTGSNRDLRIVSSSEVIKLGNSTNTKVTITNPSVSNYELALVSSGTNSLISYTANIYQNFVINGNIPNGAFNFNIDGSKFDIRQGGITFGKVVSDNKVKLFGASGDFGNDGGKTIDFYTGAGQGSNLAIDIKGGDFTFGLGRGHGGGSLPKFTFKTRLGSIRGTDHAEYDLLTLQGRDIGIGTTTPLAKLDIAETWNSNISVTGATGTGSVATITFATQAAVIPVGATVVVSSVNPSGYNGTFVVTASTVTSISYTNSTTATYVSGGTVQQLFTAVKVNVTDTASADNSNLLDLQVGGVSKFRVDKNSRVISSSFIGATSASNDKSLPSFRFSTGSFPAGLNWDGSSFDFVSGNGRFQRFTSSGIIVRDSAYFGFGNSIEASGADLTIYRDGSDILAQRRSSNPQTFRLYNTYTDATTFERLNIKWDTNVIKIGTEKGSVGGTARAMELQTDGVTRLTIATNGLATFSSTVSIGVNSQLNLNGSDSKIFSTGLAGLRTHTDGIWLMFNNAENDFNRLQFGGKTSSFPSIKRNGAGIQIRLADDSANTTLEAGNIYATGNVGIGTTSPGAPLHLQATAVNGVRENLFKATLSDAGNTSFEIYNGTNQNGRFSPGFSASMFNANDSLLFSAQTTAAYDTGSIPLVYYWCKRTNSETDPNNSTYALITSRPLFAWANNETTYMQMAANGSLGIGMTSPAATLDIADTTLAGSGSLAGSILNLAQTWNTTGAPTAIKLNVTNTASGAASHLLDLQVGGASKFKVGKDGTIYLQPWNGFFTYLRQPTNSYLFGIGLTNTSGSYGDVGLFQITSGGIGPGWDVANFAGRYSINGDTILTRDAANTLALRNGVNPQTFRLYNTYTDATTFERLNIKWDTNVLKIGTEKGSAGGTARALELQTDGVTRMTFPTNGNAIVHGFINPSYLRLQYGGGGSAHMYCSGNGRVTLYNTAETGFDRIELGGVTSSFPAIKRNGAGIQIRLADDSANAALETADLTVVGNASVSGHFSAATKSFLIDHPTKEGKKLQYGVVESNQHSVLVRGKTAENIIELPEEWAGLVHEDSVTVQLTPIGSYQQLFVISQDNQRVVVGGSTGQYNYTIYGERKDVDKLITEI